MTRDGNLKNCEHNLYDMWQSKCKALMFKGNDICWVGEYIMIWHDTIMYKWSWWQKILRKGGDGKKYDGNCNDVMTKH
jgi:hypothetical protein